MKKFIKESKAFSAFVIIALLMLIFALVAGRDNELIFTIFGQYLFLPIMGFVATVSMGRKGAKKALTALAVVIAANLLIALALFGKIDIIFLITGAVPAAVGCLIGLAVGRIRK